MNLIAPINEPSGSINTKHLCRSLMNQGPIFFFSMTRCRQFFLTLLAILLGVTLIHASVFAGEMGSSPSIETLPAKGNMRGVRASLLTREITSDQAWSVITDYNHFSEFMPLTKSSEITKSVGKTTWVLTNLKIAFTNISYLLRIDHEESGGVRRNSWVRESGDLKEIEGSWQVKGTENGTSLTYISYFDPGKAIPGWIQDLLTEKSVPDLFEAVITRAKSTHQRPRLNDKK